MERNVNSNPTNTIHSYESTDNMKFYGLKKPNYYKLFQKDIIHLTCHLNTITPPFNIVHNVMSILRILQLLLPCFIPSYSNFWISSSIDQITINILSIFYCIVPPSIICEASEYLLIVYIILETVLIVSMIFLSYYFKKFAKLPKYIPTLIYLYQSTFGYYFCPVICFAISEGISFMITNESKIDPVKLITLDLFSILCLAFNFLFVFIDISENFEFRSISLSSTTPVPHFIIFILTVFINIFFGLAVNLKKKYQIVFFCFNIVFYILAAFSVFIFGGFIQNYVSNLILSSSMTGTFFTLLDIILIVLKKNGSLIILFAFIIFFVAALIVSYFLFQNFTIRQLKMLDSIQLDNSLFSFIRSPSQFVFMAICGIRFSHPIIIDTRFFQMGTEKWKDQFVYLIYSKFVAIYPEETATLKYVFSNITSNKLNGLALLCFEEQTRSIMNHRETEMTPQLQNRLNQLKKENQSAKHKLEHVWDVVILGNINEIDLAAKGALKAINETDADIKRLLVEYPNNRNVTYFYSIFLNEIIGDHSLSQEFREKTRTLKPGNVYLNDQTHLNGLKTFPNLPNTIDRQKDQYITIDDQSEVNSSYYKEKEKDKDKDRQNTLDLIAGIKSNIEELKIPAIIGTKFLRLFTTLLIFVVPSIIGLIYVNIYIRDLEKPLEFLDSLSLIRTYSFHIISFSIRYLGENISVFPKFNGIDKNPPQSLGNTWDTKKQLEYILKATTDLLRDFDKYRNFEENNFYIKKAHSLVFDNTVQYNYYASQNNSSVSNISLQAAIIDLTIQQKSLLTGNAINPSILNSGMILNLFNNAQPITTNIHSAIRYIFDYLNNHFNNIQTIEQILFIVLIILVLVVYIITMIIQVKWINANKKETYQCLFSLPKNVVSKLAESQSMKNKENQLEDMNKQNNNIIRTFNSYGTVNNSFSDVFLLILGTFIIVVFAIICISLFLHLFLTLSRIIITTAPFLHYLLASYSMLLSSLNWFDILLFEFGGYPMPTTDFNKTLFRMKSTFEWYNSYYHILVTGSNYTNDVPLKGLTRAMYKASPKNCSFVDPKYLIFDHPNQSINTSNFNKFKFLSDTNVGSDIDLLDCMPTEMLLVLIEPIISYSIMPYQSNIENSLDPKKMEYLKIWQLLISPLYDKFFEPLHYQIFPSITKSINQQKNKIIPSIIVLLVLTIIIEIILYIRILVIENHIRSVLKLLLHCNPSVIFSSNKITRILAGDFSSQQNDSLTHNNNFFDIIFTNLPDAIMYANSDMIIQSCNAQCKRVFGDNKLVGKSITDFFMSDKFIGNVDNLFELVNSNPVEEIEYKSDSNSDIFLKVTSMMANGKFVMICQDVTQAHNYNTLILTEKQNSDKLLETILPPSLVFRVQQGEKNISLSVQSASILFSDIVSFTPWCGSLPAEKVMSTLNILFKRMDSILDTKPTMTKIKCIGDCYMAAGGIFAELNQPAIHAREVVSFGLLSINEVLSINNEIHENLRIRVGVNTGGPIVAGVLGIGKPTFEIIGPAINRAQQMEQNGIPMKVHISISVYELICGFNFKFSNPRTIECKNEKVETYIVEP